VEGDWIYQWSCSSSLQGSSTFDQPCETPEGVPASVDFTDMLAGATRWSSGEAGGGAAIISTQLRGEEQGCVFPPEQMTEKSGTRHHAPLTELAPRLLRKPYIISLTATKGSRQIELQAPVVVFPGSGPLVKVEPLPSEGAVNPGDLVVVTAFVTSNSTGLSACPVNPKL